MITFFAHATSIDNEKGIRAGWQDSPLSALGLEQAARLREKVADEPFDSVFASDLERAAETARIAFPGYNLVLDARLRELNYGELNGAHGRDFPADETRWIETRFPGGENCIDVQQRVLAFLEEHYDPDRNIAIVAHRFPQLALEVICSGRSWREAIKNDWRHSGAWQPGWRYEWGT